MRAPSSSFPSTWLGKLVEQELGISFIPVEAIFLENMRTSRLSGSERDAEGYARVVAEVDRVLQHGPSAIVETTATSEHFPGFLAALRQHGAIKLVAVRAPADVCLERIRARESATHIPVSPERVAEINAVAARVELPWDLAIDNAGAESAREMLDELRRLAVQPRVPALEGAARGRAG